MILVVEDHPDLGYSMRLSLEGAGYRTVRVASGEDAVGWLALHRPGLIVLDDSLPGLSGLDVLRHVRGAAELRDVPVIVANDGPDGEVEAEFVRLGVSGFLRKGSDPIPQLLSLVGRHLGPA